MCNHFRDSHTPGSLVHRGMTTVLSTRDNTNLVKISAQGGPALQNAICAWLAKNNLSADDIQRRVQAYQANLDRHNAESAQRLAEFRNQQPLPPTAASTAPSSNVEIRRAMMYMEEVEVRALCFHLLSHIKNKENKDHRSIAKYVEAAAPDQEDLFTVATYVATQMPGKLNLVNDWLATNGLSKAEIQRRVQAYQANLQRLAAESAQRWAEIRPQLPPPPAASGSLHQQALRVFPLLQEAEVQAMCYHMLSLYSDKGLVLHRTIVRYATPATRNLDNLKAGLAHGGADSPQANTIYTWLREHGRI